MRNTRAVFQSKGPECPQGGLLLEFGGRVVHLEKGGKRRVTPTGRKQIRGKDLVRGLRFDSAYPLVLAKVCHAFRFAGQTKLRSKRMRFVPMPWRRVRKQLNPPPS